MKRLRTRTWWVAALAAVLLSGCGSSEAPDAAGARALSTAEARALAREAYVVAYPAVSNYAKQSRRAFDRGSPTYVGTNRLFHLPLLLNSLTASLADVPSPNHDTLYSSGVLDLRLEPAVLSAGAASDPDRYYSLQLLDLNTNVLPYISSLTHQNRGGNYLVLGPGQQADAALAARFDGVIRSPSGLVTVLGRVQAFNEADQLAAAQVQRSLQAQTLSAWLGTAAPGGTAEELPAYDEAQAEGLGFFDYASLAFRLQPPEESDPALAARLARIGLGSGAGFDATALTAQLREALLAGIEDGRVAVERASLTRAVLRNGWSSVDPAVMSDTGSFGTDYLARAAVAYSLLYMNTRVESWYGLAQVDGEGAALDGTRDYVLRFAAGSLPPSRYFWSVTAYDADTRLFFNDVLLPRYNISSTTPGLRYAEDGSLEIPVSRLPPAGATAANWLPVAGRPFYLIIRSYGPGDGILDGSWIPPPVLRQ